VFGVRNSAVVGNRNLVLPARGLVSMLTISTDRTNVTDLEEIASLKSRFLPFFPSGIV
jgi:hypothetical protein